MHAPRSRTRSQSSKWVDSPLPSGPPMKWLLPKEWIRQANHARWRKTYGEHPPSARNACRGHEVWICLEHLPVEDPSGRGRAPQQTISHGSRSRPKVEPGALPPAPKLHSSMFSTAGSDASVTDRTAPVRKTNAAHLNTFARRRRCTSLMHLWVWADQVGEEDQGDSWKESLRVARGSTQEPKEGPWPPLATDNSSLLGCEKETHSPQPFPLWRIEERDRSCSSSCIKPQLETDLTLLVNG